MTQKTIGLNAPVGFPGTQYDELNELVASSAPVAGDQWYAFGTAWNAVAYRTVGADRESARYGAAITKTSSPPPAERFEQDDALFAFSFYSLSVLECFFAAAYCVGSLADAANFPMCEAKHLHISPSSVRGNFLSAYPSDSLTSLMARVVDDPMFTKLSLLRNVMSHRGTLPRTHYAGQDEPSTIPVNLKDLPTNWVYSTPIDQQLVQDVEIWRREATNDLVVQLHAFARHNLQPRALAS